MMLQEKKVMLKGLEILSTSFFLQLPKRTSFICQSSEQNRLDNLMYIYAYMCTSIYNINVLSWSHQGGGKLEGTQNSLSSEL